MRNAYRVNSKTKSGQNRVSTAELCFAWDKFFIERKSLERNLEICGRIPAIIYKFENQNIQIFFDNTKYMGDLPFAIFFDFKTTSDKKICNFEEDFSFYPVSYSFVVAFYPCLNMEKIFAVQSFNQSFESLVDVTYLSKEMRNVTVV